MLQGIHEARCGVVWWSEASDALGLGASEVQSEPWKCTKALETTVGASVWTQTAGLDVLDEFEDLMQLPALSRPPQHPAEVVNS